MAPYSTGIGTVPRGTPAPALIPLAQLRASFRGPRTFTDPNTKQLRYTAAWANYLRQHGYGQQTANDHGPVTGPKQPPGGGGPAASGPPPKPTTPPQHGYEWTLLNGAWVQKRVETDPRDGEYQARLAHAAAEKQRGLNQIDADRATFASMYNRGAQDIRTGFDRSRYDSNADLASRGIVRSGEYQRRGADREMGRIRQVADLENQYGTGAHSRLASRLNDINQSYALTEQSELASAMERYKQRYPLYIGGLMDG